MNRKHFQINFNHLRANSQLMILLAATLVIAITCSKKEEVMPSVIPVLSTAPVTDVQRFSASSGGNITYDGGSAVTERGVCWSKNQLPTISDAKTADGSGTGDYISFLSGLSQGTTYYVRSYMVNQAGPTYGDQRTFVTSSDFIAVAAGAQHSMALMKDGSLWACGWGGPGPFMDLFEKTFKLIGTGFTVIADGRSSLALKSDGSLWGWGSNIFNNKGGLLVEPVLIIGKDYISVAAGDGVALAVRADGTLWEWTGATASGNPGTIPVLIGTGFSKVATGGSYYAQNNLGLKADGTVWAWTELTWNNPSLIGSGFISISSGTHSLAIKSDHTLWAWGDNSSGQLGDGSFVNKSTPILIGSDFYAIDAGANYSLAVKSDGTLWAWGDNSSGQLGDGTNVNKNVPVQIGQGYVSVAASKGFLHFDQHSMGIKADGTLWTWGGNAAGQLGDGTLVSRNLPVQISH